MNRFEIALGKKPKPEVKKDLDFLVAGNSGIACWGGNSSHVDVLESSLSIYRSVHGNEITIELSLGIKLSTKFLSFEPGQLLELKYANKKIKILMNDISCEDITDDPYYRIWKISGLVLDDLPVPRPGRTITE